MEPTGEKINTLMTGLKRLGPLFLFVFIGLAFARPAAASFEQGRLIRVVYDTTGTAEVATDLGVVSFLESQSDYTVGGGADAISLSDFGGAGWADLRVAYFAYNVPTQDIWLSGDLNTAPTSGALKLITFTGAAGNVTAYYAGLGGSTVHLQKSDAKSYYSRMDQSGNSIGTFAGFIPSPIGTEAGLGDFGSVGYVDQILYFFDNPNIAAQGVETLTIRTMDDGGTLINPIVNQAPSADAGPNQLKNEGEAVTLDGRGSDDPDGSITTYQWSQTTGSPVILTGGDTAVATFTVPEGSVGETFAFELTVTDDGG